MSVSPERPCTFVPFENPEPLVAEIGKLIRDRDPRVPIVAMSTLEQEVQSSLWQERLLTLLTVFFSIVSLGLAAAGIYGALAYSVASRTREIGIRLAIGASTQDIIRAVCGRLAVAVTAGLALGVVASAVLMHLARRQFFGVEALDPFTFAIALLSILLLGIGAAASPALRAVRTDPAGAMRSE